MINPPGGSVTGAASRANPPGRLPKYYHADEAKTSAAMRPSPTLNAAIEALA
jgi:monomeric isocitrate dehydrogenase